MALGPGAATCTSRGSTGGGGSENTLGGGSAVGGGGSAMPDTAASVLSTSRSSDEHKSADVSIEDVPGVAAPLLDVSECADRGGATGAWPSERRFSWGLGAGVRGGVRAEPRKRGASVAEAASAAARPPMGRSVRARPSTGAVGERAGSAASPAGCAVRGRRTGALGGDTSGGCSSGGKVMELSGSGRSVAEGEAAISRAGGTGRAGPSSPYEPLDTSNALRGAGCGRASDPSSSEELSMEPPLRERVDWGRAAGRGPRAATTGGVDDPDGRDGGELWDGICFREQTHASLGARTRIPTSCAAAKRQVFGEGWRRGRRRKWKPRTRRTRSRWPRWEPCNTRTAQQVAASAARAGRHWHAAHSPRQPVWAR